MRNSLSLVSSDGENSLVTERREEEMTPQDQAGGEATEPLAPVSSLPSLLFLYCFIITAELLPDFSPFSVQRLENSLTLLVILTQTSAPPALPLP